MYILKLYSNTINWDKTLTLKRFPFVQNKRYKKMHSFFLSPAPTHHNFTLSSPFLYELKDKVHLSQTVCRIFHFRFRLAFIKVYFCSTKSMDSLTSNLITSTQLKIIEKPHTVFLPDLWFSICNKNLKV